MFVHLSHGSNSFIQSPNERKREKTNLALASRRIHEQTAHNQAIAPPLVLLPQGLVAWASMTECRFRPFQAHFLVQVMAGESGMRLFPKYGHLGMMRCLVRRITSSFNFFHLHYDGVPHDECIGPPQIVEWLWHGKFRACFASDTIQLSCHIGVLGR